MQNTRRFTARVHVRGPGLLALFVVLAAGLSMQAADQPHKPVCRIMPIGDSITAGGTTFSCYRYPLLEKLTSAGYRLEYVGSQKSDSPVGKLRHEGHGGTNAEFLATVVDKAFREHPADIILVHAGHNHFADEQPVGGIVKATEAMIKTVRDINPRVIVLLAQVIPSGKLPKYSYIPALNDQLATLAARLHTADQPVIVVNQADGFDWRIDTVDDKVHPNAQGAAKMADRWCAALVPILDTWP